MCSDPRLSLTLRCAEREVGGKKVRAVCFFADDPGSLLPSAGAERGLAEGKPRRDGEELMRNCGKC